MDSHCIDRWGVQRETAFILAGGFQRRVTRSLAHDFPQESLVCYTFVLGVSTAGEFCMVTDEIRICIEGKIHLTGKGNKGISTPIPPQRHCLG